MDADDVQELMAALRRNEVERERSAKEVGALRATVEQLVTVLVGRGVLNEGHRRLFEKVAERAGASVRSRVRLRQYVDKYQMAGADIDCAARLPLCQARCCALSFELSSQDLDEGKIRWEVEEPYLIRHERDGYCHHLDRQSGGCGAYLHRPAACRGFDCRQDARIWIDFERQIPAPMPAGLRPILDLIKD